MTHSCVMCCLVDTQTLCLDALQSFWAHIFKYLLKTDFLFLLSVTITLSLLNVIVSACCSHIYGDTRGLDCIFKYQLTSWGSGAYMFFIYLVVLFLLFAVLCGWVLLESMTQLFFFLAVVCHFIGLHQKSKSHFSPFISSFICLSVTQCLSY